MNGGGYYPMAYPSPLSPEPSYPVPSSVPGLPNISNTFPDPYPAAPEVYSDIYPTPYATDTPALMPTEPLPVVADPWFDWQAPLIFPEETMPTHLPDTPTQLPLTGSPGLPVNIGETGVFPLITEPAGPIEWIIDAGGNVVEFAGDVIKTGADILWDTGKFILDHLDVGVKYAGEIGGQETQKRYYEDIGEAQQTAADAAKIKAEAYAAQVRAGTMTPEEAMARGVGLGIDTLADIMPGDDGPTYFSTAAAAGGPNYLLYAAIGLAAYYILK